MKPKEYILKSLLHAGAVALYVTGVATLLSNTQNIFGDKEDTVAIPIFMLLLLIISATITGLLVLGRPLYLYFSGMKKEAIILLLSILGWLVVFLVCAGVVIAKM